MVSLETAHKMQQQLLERLKELNVSYELHTHPQVLTVEEQAAQVKGISGEFSKNLLLKDKKGRLILIAALTSTKVDLKLLSQRLGLGKGGLRMAPDENLTAVLQVPTGCVTPLAVCNESASSVVLLLDSKFTSQSQLLFHPLANDATIAVTREGLDSFLRAMGREPTYVDLEANVVVGKDQPPDLACYLPAAASAAAAAAAEGDGVKDAPLNTTASASQPKQPSAAAAAAAAPSAGGKSMGAASSQKKSTAPAAPSGPAGDDVALCTARVLEMLTEHMKACQGGGGAEASTASSKEEFAINLQHTLVMFKNAAYTSGFFAGRSVQPSKGC